MSVPAPVRSCHTIHRDPLALFFLQDLTQCITFHDQRVRYFFHPFTLAGVERFGT